MEELSFDRNNAPLNYQATTTFLIQSFNFAEFNLQMQLNSG